MKFLLKRRVQKEDKQNSREGILSQSSSGTLGRSASTQLSSTTATSSTSSTADSLASNSRQTNYTPAATPELSSSPTTSSTNRGHSTLPSTQSSASSQGRSHSPPVSSSDTAPRRSRSPVRSSNPVSPVSSSKVSRATPSDSSPLGASVMNLPSSNPLDQFNMGDGGVDLGSSGFENSLEQNNPFSELPLLGESPPGEHQTLFRKKLQACSVVYDFTRNVQLKSKEAKRQTLLELVKYVNNTRNCFSEPIMAALVEMVSANIFRTLPPSAASITGATYDPEDDDPQLEAAWPHLQIVYEFFLRFIVSTEVDPKAVKRYIDHQFVLKLLDLFSSEDPRERDYLKTILHRIYGKIMALRSFIRKAIQQVFFCFIYEQESHRGISELLEILGSIINGFALPLKEEHKSFLSRSLIPLHKVRSLCAFNQQLTYCMTQYVEKDSRLAEQVILGLLRYWPVTNTNKEVVFLNELEEILELTQPPEFQKVMCPLFKRLALCIQSPHFQVAERVLFLWNNEYIVTLFNNHKQQLFPLVISALYKNSNEHWNSTVHGLTYNVSKLLAEADPKLFDACSGRNMVQQAQKAKEQEEASRKWKELEKKSLTAK